MFRNHLSSHRRSAKAADAPEIAAFEAAVVAAQEQRWDIYAVSEDERARLRPAIAAQAKAVADRLRAEHAARVHR